LRPLVELRDRRVALGELWPGRVVEEMTDRIGSGEPASEVLEQAVRTRLAELPRPDPRVGEIVAQVIAGRSVTTAASAIGQSDRHLRRLAAHAFGYSTKTLQRILRFQLTLSLVRGGDALATAAYRAGYADQAHMSRDVKELAGLPMTAILSS
jgi:AraC-like DNA-binding protein